MVFFGRLCIEQPALALFAHIVQVLIVASFMAGRESVRKETVFSMFGKESLNE